MTTDQHSSPRTLGSLSSADGRGVVRMEDRFETGIDDLWSALTDPTRLAGWYGEIQGDLRVGGQYRARLFASGWKGTGHIEACEPPRRLLLSTIGPGRSGKGATEVTLTADGDQTLLVWAERGMPLDLIDAYGAGIQVHVEDLIEHIAPARLRARPSAEMGGSKWRSFRCRRRSVAPPERLGAPRGTPRSAGLVRHGSLSGRNRAHCQLMASHPSLTR